MKKVPKIKKITPGKLSGPEAVKIIKAACEEGQLHYTDVGINRMSMSVWSRGEGKPDVGSCYKIVDLLTCNGIPAELVLPNKKSA